MLVLERLYVFAQVGLLLIVATSLGAMLAPTLFTAPLHAAWCEAHQ